MIGWEYPPHISGGLGTACQGLSTGLASAGVDITFVVPRVYGDEDAPHMRIVGANQVRFTRRERKSTTGERRVDVAVDVADSATAVGAAGRAAMSAEALEQAARALERAVPIVEGTPALSNYNDPGDGGGALPADVRARLEAWLPPELAERLGSVPTDEAGWRELVRAIERGIAPRPVGRIAALDGGAEEYEWEERFDFHGGYGKGLFDEVARYALAVAEIARIETFDVIHAHDWISFPAAAAAAAVSGKAVVAHVHASEYDRSGENVNHAVKRIEQLGLDVAKRVVCVSYYTASVLRKRYRLDPAKVRVVHNAVTQQEQRREWHLERHVSDPIVLFLGRITFQKGPDYFLEAAARVVRVRPDVLFVLSGSGDMLPAMVERSAQLGLARNAVFTGFLRGKDVERMYSHADLYVMPSVSEPFGITPLEAMALDVPVIVSRQSGVSEILTHALKVDFWDVEELANKILAVLEYAPLRESLVESGRDEVRRMRWELRGQLVRDIYQELLS